jgi:hypothetical protein
VEDQWWGRWFSSSLRWRATRKNGASLQRDLSHAVERRELHLDCQPVVRMSDGRVVCVEALLRWYNPDRGLISPALVIPFAEESGASFRSDVGSSDTNVSIGTVGSTRRPTNRSSWASTFRRTS